MYTKRISSYAYLRAAACIAIILLHICNAAEILYRDQITLAEKIASLSVVSCMMWAVPCFVMVSGALLLDPKRTVTIRRIFSRYLLRIFLALVICCVLFRGFDMVMNGEPVSPVFITDGLWKMLTGGSWAHLWYLYLLIGIYLLLPFYRKVAEYSSKAELKYLLLVYFLFLSVLQMTQLAGAQTAFYIHVSTIYPFYLFAGYAIAERKVKITFPVSFALLGAGAAGVVICTCLRWAYQLEVLDCLLNYSSVFTVLISCGVFSLFCGGAGAQEKQAAKPGKAGKILESIDANSFGIYLLHMMAVRLILRYYGLNPFRYGMWMFLLLTVFIFAVTYLVVRLLRTIPAVRIIL
ncbi:MAG: acyltransferase [Eubacterium sp.]|nr:acyltransferase [Eubacterium sp.]